MYRIRPVREKDAGCLKQLSAEAHLGLTNLPKDDHRRNGLLERVYATFKEQSDCPYYLFALEDTLQRTIVGVAGIFPQTGGTTPLEYFRLERMVHTPHFEECPDHYDMLNIVRYDKGPTEICSLYLAHYLRKEGLGKLLSFSRFLFMKAFPERFHPQVFAEMRGFSDDAGNSPFWDAVGRRFCPLTYADLLARKDRGDAHTSSLFPDLPILLDLLPDAIRPIIGSTHPSTAPALRILKEQGFQKTGEFDLYDAGPRVMAKREEIKAIQQSKRGKVVEVATVEGKPSLLSNTRLDFRACWGGVLFKETGIVLDKEAFKLLEIEIGDEVLILT